MRVFSSYFRKGRRAVALAAVVTVSVSAVAVADFLQADGNTLAVAGKNVTVLPGGSGSATFYVTESNHLVTGDNPGCGVGGIRTTKDGVTDERVKVTVTSSNTAVIPNPGDVYISDCGTGAAESVSYTVATNATPGTQVTITGAPSGGKAGHVVAGGDTDSDSVPDTNKFVVTVGTPAAPADATAPTSSVSATTPDDGDADEDPESYVFGDWTNDDVTVTLTASDNAGGTGVDEIRYTTDGSTPTADDVYAAPFTISAEGTTTIKWLAVDNAGNAEPVQSRVVKIDKTEPVISASATKADGSVYERDTWTNQNVSVAFSCSDGTGSGVESNTLTGDTVSAEGATGAVTNGGACTDRAGNSADSLTFSPIKIDKTGPTIALASGSSCPTGALTVGQSVSVNWAAADGLSGVASPTSAQTVATTVQLGSSGLGVAAGAATDNLGNASVATTLCSLRGAYDLMWLAPINGNALNSGKTTRAYPIKWQLREYVNGQLQLISDATAQQLLGSMYSQETPLTCTASSLTVDPLELDAGTTPPTNISYDALADHFHMVYKAPRDTGCRKLAFARGDGLRTPTVLFSFTK